MRIDPAPRDLGRILDDALVLYRGNFRTIVLSALMVLLPVVLLGSVAGSAVYTITFSQALSGIAGGGDFFYAAPPGSGFVTGLLQVLFYVTVPVRFVAAVWLASSIHRSTPGWMVGVGQSVREFLLAGKERVLQLGVARFALAVIDTIARYVVVFAAFLLGITAFAVFAMGGAAGLVVGLFAMVVIALAGFLAYLLALSPFQAWGPAVVVEDAGIGSGLSRSLELVRGMAWRTVGFWMSVWMVSYAFRAAVYGPAVLVLVDWLGPVVQDPTAASATVPLWIAVLLGVSAAVAEVFAVPFERACWTQYYLDLRARQEGMDLVMRARELADAPA